MIRLVYMMAYIAILAYWAKMLLHKASGVVVRKPSVANSGPGYTMQFGTCVVAWFRDERRALYALNAIRNTICSGGRFVTMSIWLGDTQVRYSDISVLIKPLTYAFDDGGVPYVASDIRVINRIIDRNGGVRIAT